MEAIHATYAHYVLHSVFSFELEPPSVDEISRRHEEIIAAGLPFLVAEMDGRIVGYAYASTYRLRPAYAYTVEDSVYVDPATTGQGIGHDLLQLLIARCEALDLRQMIAVIGDSANKPSIRLHERLGFRHVGVLSDVGWKQDRWLDTILMQRQLRSGSDTPPA
jgi:phosphinothricin acetyltransferase